MSRRSCDPEPRPTSPKLPVTVWLGANFWSRTGGPLMWRSYDPARRARGAGRAARPRAEHDPVVLLLARLHARARTASTSSSCAHYADFLDAHAERGHGHHPDLHRRPHVRGELGPGLARAAATCTGTCGWSPGRRGSSAQMTARVHRAPGGRRLAGHQRDADLRRDRPPPSTVTAWAQLMVRRGARRRRHAAGVARRRRLGHRGHRRATTASRCATGRRSRLRRPARLPDGDDPVRQHLRRRVRLRARGRRRQARSCWRSSGCPPTSCPPATPATTTGRCCTTRLLAGATGWIAWNNTDYDDLLTRTPTATTPSSCTSASPTGDGTPEAAAAEMRDFARMLDRGRPSALRARSPTTHGAGRAVLPGGRVPVHRRPRTAVRASTPLGRRTSPRGRPTWRPGSCGSGTGSTAATRSTWCRRPSSSPRPTGPAAGAGRGRGDRLVSYCAGDNAVAARPLVRPTLERCSASAPRSSTGWPTRSRTTRSSLRFVAPTSATSRRARADVRRRRRARAAARTCR